MRKEMLKPGDRVKLGTKLDPPGAGSGTVVRVGAFQKHRAGTKGGGYTVRVKWDGTGSESSVDDRRLVKLEEGDTMKTRDDILKWLARCYARGPVASYDGGIIAGHGEVTSMDRIVEVVRSLARSELNVDSILWDVEVRRDGKWKTAWRDLDTRERAHELIRELGVRGFEYRAVEVVRRPEVKT